MEPGTEFVTIVSIVNDGGWHQNGMFERCLMYAKHDFMQAGGWSWSHMLITSLPCNDRETHYPNLCYHYEVTFSVAE